MPTQINRKWLYFLSAAALFTGLTITTIAISCGSDSKAQALKTNASFFMQKVTNEAHQGSKIADLKLENYDQKQPLKLYVLYLNKDVSTKFKFDLATKTITLVAPSLTIGTYYFSFKIGDATIKEEKLVVTEALKRSAVFETLQKLDYQLGINTPFLKVNFLNLQTHEVPRLMITLNNQDVSKDFLFNFTSKKISLKRKITQAGAYLFSFLLNDKKIISSHRVLVQAQPPRVVFQNAQVLSTSATIGTSVLSVRFLNLPSNARVTLKVTQNNLDVSDKFLFDALNHEIKVKSALSQAGNCQFSFWINNQQIGESKEVEITEDTSRKTVQFLNPTTITNASKSNERVIDLVFQNLDAQDRPTLRVKHNDKDLSASFDFNLETKQITLKNPLTSLGIYEMQFILNGQLLENIYHFEVIDEFITFEKLAESVTTDSPENFPLWALRFNKAQPQEVTLKVMHQDKDVTTFFHFDEEQLQITIVQALISQWDYFFSFFDQQNNLVAKTNLVITAGFALQLENEKNLLEDISANKEFLPSEATISNLENLQNFWRPSNAQFTYQIVDFATRQADDNTGILIITLELSLQESPLKVQKSLQITNLKNLGSIKAFELDLSPQATTSETSLSQDFQEFINLFLNWCWRNQ